MTQLTQNLLMIASISAVHIAALVSPGPDFVITVKNAIQHSRKTGITTAIGVGLGIIVHISYCMAGLALIISESILAFNLIKWVGAAYLIYLGIQSIKSKNNDQHTPITKQQKARSISQWKALKMGFITNVLNPKATVYFLSIFSLLLKPETPTIVLWTTAIIMVLSTMIWFTLVATMFTHHKVQKGYIRFQNAINKTLGGFLLLLGVTMIVKD